MVKEVCERDHLMFTRTFFREVQGSEFNTGPHHRVMSKVIDDVLAGRRKRVIINVPPGYTKTEAAVIALIARGFALNPRARFIHASFSGELVNENSTRVKDTIATEPYREMWDVAFRADIDAKGRWKTAAGGGLLAKPAGGPITGFRAGLMEPGFTGCMVIDDPLKPDDALFPVKRNAVNSRWHSTFKSRLAHEDVPVLVIMQRLHTDDFCGFLLTGGGGCRWDHLMLPVLIDNSEPYPSEFTHGDPIPHGLPDGPLWEAKHSMRHIEELKLDQYTFDAQYMQRPSALGGNLFKEAWIRDQWDELPILSHRIITADTAQKTGTHNDWSVFQCWGRGRDNGHAYLIDQVRLKCEAPELLTTALAFWKKHQAALTTTHGILRSLRVEDKVSGTGLIQQLRRLGIPVMAIERGLEKSKGMRAMDVVPYWAAGLVHLPAQAPWLGEFVRELLSFTVDGGAAHDDQVDPMVDALVDLLGGPVPLTQWV